MKEKLFYMNCLRCSSNEEVFPKHLEVTLEINGMQSTKVLKEGSTVQLLRTLKIHLIT